MPIQTTANIWHNGQLIPWDKAQIHVMSHVIHYGSSVFEGIRCYTQPSGAGVFRLQEHMQRLVDSAKIYRMPLPYSADQLSAAVAGVDGDERGHGRAPPGVSARRRPLGRGPAVLPACTGGAIRASTYTRTSTDAPRSG